MSIVASLVSRVDGSAAGAEQGSGQQAPGAGQEHGVLSTTHELMSLEAFYAVVWTGFAVSVFVFSGRIWIRWTALRRIFSEDYVMFFVLLLQLATCIICQLRLRYVYEMEEVGNGLRMPPPTFLEDVPKGLRGLLASQILSVIAIWGVKANLLLFFYRLFSLVVMKTYRRIWWGVVVITIISFGVFMGLISYKCTASDVEVIMGHCTTPDAIRLEWIQVQTSSAVDAFNDALIMIFPIMILWRVRLSTKKKIYLSFIFLVTLLVIAMAIIRGTISYGRVASDYSQSQNISWVWFWVQMELIVSFMVACLVSFRALFTHQKEKTPPPKSGDDSEMQGNRPWQRKKKPNLYGSILDTVHNLEGTTNVDSSIAMSEDVPRERLGSNWSNQEAWLDSRVTENESVQSLNPTTAR